MKISSPLKNAFMRKDISTVSVNTPESVTIEVVASEEQSEVLEQPVSISAETLAQEKNEALVVTEAYCVKCRTKRGMQNSKRIVTKNGRNAMEGVCPVCDTRLFRFVAAE